MMCAAAPVSAIAMPIVTSELDEQNSVTLLGKVLNENNEPLAGVVIKVVDTTIQEDEPILIVCAGDVKIDNAKY